MTTPEPTLDPSGGSDRVADGHRRIVRSSVPQGRFLVVADWREKLFDGGGFLSDAQVAERVAIKDTGPHHVERIVLVGGESVVVKTYRPKGLLRRLGALLPGAGAMGEWTRGLRCHQAGVACAEPLAAGRLAHASGATVLVTRYLEGARDLAEASREGLLDGPARHLTARALGVFMRTLHDAGFIHHDATAMNFMTTITGDTVRLWAIDLKRMKHLGELTDDHRKRNLTTLFRTMRRIGSWTDYHRFLASYLGDPWADRRKAWARELQVRGTAELTRYLWRWSEPGYMVSRRRVDVSRQGGVLWYARRGQADASVVAILADPESALRSSDADEGAAKAWRVRRATLRDACRRLRVATFLESGGMRTPAVVAMGQRRTGLASGIGYVVSRDPPGSPLDTVLRAATTSQRASLLHELARAAARLHDLRVGIEELTPSAMHVDAHGQIWMVDTDVLGAGRDSIDGAAGLAPLLERLSETCALTADERQALVRDYARARRSEHAGAS